MKPAALSLLLCLCLPFTSFAQNVEEGTCGLHFAEEQLRARHAHEPHKLQKIEDDIEALEIETQKFTQQGMGKSGSNYVIPVVFHIIHNNGPENITDEQVYDAVNFLNKDFNKDNGIWQTVEPTFLGLVADIGIEFRLAQKDENGNCTNGITRTVSPLTTDGGFAMKSLIQWDRSNYLNIWVCAAIDGSPNVAAYTQYPGSVNNFPSSDGIVSRHPYIGSIGTGSLSRTTTLAHEVGHWLNLRHTWGNSNEPGLTSNCGMDDLVSDTPNTIGWSSCNTSAMSCGSLDNVENYMDYAGCRKMFTEGQKTRMLAALNSGVADRNELWQPSNLAATGTDGPDILCSADLSADNTIICAGDSVMFTDESFNGVTGWNWDFPGGMPNASTNESPVVYYDTPGVYDVSLTADNGNSNVSTTKPQYITVLPAVGYPTPYQEGFENTTSLPNEDWFPIDGQSDGTFQVSSSAAYSGSKSIKLTNNTNDAGYLDELISNTIDLSNLQDVTITFKYAFKRRNNNNDDRLRFYVSSDCGRSWSMREQLRGQTDLPTGSNQGGSFTPQSQSDWQEIVIDNIQSSHLQSDFRFKFWFESDGGNNLWIDDINIFGTPVGIEELSAESIDLNIFPNPITDVSTLSFELFERSEVQMDIMDVLGRTVLNVSNGTLSQGRHQFPISRNDMGNGMYFIRMTVDGRTTMVKFMVR